MGRQLRDIAILAALFLATVYGLKAMGFWSMTGLEEPRGYIVQGLLFFGIWVALQAFLFGPHLKIIDTREEETEGKRAAAEKTRQRAEDLLARYRQGLEEAQMAARRERERRLLQAEEEERARLQSARQEGETSLRAAQKELESEGERLRSSLNAELPQLAGDVVDRVLGHPAQNATHNSAATPPAAAVNNR